jgi:hypothetical protein
MAISYSTTLRNTRLDAITTAIDAGTAGLLVIYSGTRPATGGTATTILAELTLSATSFPASAAGAMTANVVTGDASANNTGTASWFRITDSTGAFVMDGDVGATGSGADMELNTVSVQSGVAVDITSFVITAGNA